MSDFCYSVSVLDRVIAQAERMDNMMGAIGVNRLIAIRCENSASWYEARTRCIDCAVERQCKSWIDDTASDQPRDPPPFCPNTAFFLACREEASDSDVPIC
jgi:hypothetical protein